MIYRFNIPIPDFPRINSGTPHVSAIIVYKRTVDSKSTAYFPARPKLLTSGRTDGQTDRHGA